MPPRKKKSSRSKKGGGVDEDCVLGKELLRQKRARERARGRGRSRVQQPQKTLDWWRGSQKNYGWSGSVPPFVLGDRAMSRYYTDGRPRHVDYMLSGDSKEKKALQKALEEERSRTKAAEKDVERWKKRAEVAPIRAWRLGVAEADAGAGDALARFRRDVEREDVASEAPTFQTAWDSADHRVVEDINAQLVDEAVDEHRLARSMPAPPRGQVGAAAAEEEEEEGGGLPQWEGVHTLFDDDEDLGAGPADATPARPTRAEAATPQRGWGSSGVVTMNPAMASRIRDV